MAIYKNVAQSKCTSNHCDFQTPVPPTPGRIQLAMDSYCQGNVAQSAMNDRTEPFLRCSDLRVISGCHLGRDTDDRKYVCVRRFAPLFIARLIFWPMRSSQRNRVAREIEVRRNCAKKSLSFVKLWLKTHRISKFQRHWQRPRDKWNWLVGKKKEISHFGGEDNWEL